MARLEVDVFRAKPGALEQPQASAVEEARHELRCPGELRDHRAHLVAREDDRETTRTTGAHQVVEPWQLHTNDFPVQEEERCQGLVLGRSADLGLDGERGQKAGGLGGAQLARVTLAVNKM